MYRSCVDSLKCLRIEGKLMPLTMTMTRKLRTTSWWHRALATTGSPAAMPWKGNLVIQHVFSVLTPSNILILNPHQVRFEGQHHCAEQRERGQEEEAGAGRGKLDPSWHRLCSDWAAWKVQLVTRWFIQSLSKKQINQKERIQTWSSNRLCLDWAAWTVMDTNSLKVIFEH